MLETLLPYFTTAIYIVISLYLVFASSVIIGWFKLKSQKKPFEIKKHNRFSVLIAVRNENRNIANLLRDLKNQTYPKESFEIIIIDDHSEDNTLEIVTDLNIPNLRIVKSKGQGKKVAIHTGLEHVSNEFIIQTDADCFLEKDWIDSINAYINFQPPKLLIAPVIFKKETSFFSNLQALDFMALMMSTAGLAGINKAFMANGANLIYPKSIMKDLSILKPELASGDDIFLLHHCKKQYGKSSIHFLKSNFATVETKASDNLSSFFNQRLRWASKSRFYKDQFTLTIGFLILIINVLLLASLVLSFFSASYWPSFLSLFLSKAIVDLVILLPILVFYKRLSLLIYFPILSVLNLFYTSFVGLMSQIASFEWKNRKYQT